jgi:alkylation response protein AidB-like acyl-CoA dehydrogenase
VLARTPDAPPGLKGISLFLVPKKIRSTAGTLQNNDIHALSVEHKMGIRASACRDEMLPAPKGRSSNTPTSAECC